MIVLAILLSTTCALLSTLLFDSWKKPKNYPPGPKPFRIVGNFPQVLTSGWGNIMERTMDLSKKYGKVYSFNFGGHRGIVINDLKILKETFSSLHACGRPKLEAFAFINDNKLRGMGVQDGEAWKQLRRFTVKQLGQYGFGKRTIEVIIADEAAEMVQYLNDNSLGRPISTKGLFNLFSLNVLWNIIASQRLSRSDPEVNAVVQGIVNHSGGSLELLFCVLFTDIARKIPKVSGLSELDHTNGLINSYLQKFIKSRKNNYFVGRKDDFMDVFLEKVYTEKDQDSCFFGTLGEENLKASIYDLFVAGIETTSTTLCWLLLYLALHPEKQEKLQDEIDAVLEGRFPTLQERSKMPYLEAVITETMRKSSVLPMGVFHSTLEDTQIGGYDIPKDTIIAPNFFAIHHDPEIWGDPLNFRPERFLSPDGRTFLKHEAVLAFSTGKRVCIGEQIAKDELFYFVSSIFQKFQVTWNPLKKKPTMKSNATYIMAPQPHELVFAHR